MPFLAAIIAAILASLLATSYWLWRYWWFWRNPPRQVSKGEHFLSPADGTVVYVKHAAPHEPIISCKKGQAVSINDIARDELDRAKILIGVFMSPFSVHFNRAPLTARLAYKRQYPAIGKNLHMSSMHWRSIWRKLPIYARSPHVVQNNRAVSRWCGRICGMEISWYIVQIGGGSVHGIDIHTPVGEQVEQGQVFGMIRIGSQVDLIVPDLPGLSVLVSPGDRVVAGETVLIACPRHPMAPP
jgi:phosphatidylserine decarboxylase